MPKVEFKRVETDEEVENINIKDGQLIYSKTGKTFMDYGNERIPTGSGGEGGSTEVYIQDTEPTEEDWKLWIDSDKQADNTYYNDNGTPTNIKTTTFDTLPVGAEVDYDGSVVPSGWTEVDDPNTYSTDEVKIGTWIDGKPLYRKVIQTTIPTSGNNQNISFQNNVAIMKSVTGFALQSASGGFNLILPYVSMSNSWSIYAYYNRANQELVIENSGASFMNNTTCYLIAEYTKTTD